ncbi:hypothetical protein [Synechococcus sp. MU1617]|uniref:hypothetical protein n=1 Tax=Synechococcus sp. MU1617 TaxID=2508346 RepID=UPI001CF842A1|nr:hypothetical protein [Synechococcus sp. MU1617]MCB4389463.1 hypothetical protein [Synechococcus sp. MU1617]
MSIADKVIIARHPSSKLLPISNPKLVQFCGAHTYLERLELALSQSESEYVLLAADDDFYVPSSVESIIDKLSFYPNFSSVSAITLHLEKVTEESISLNPYLISSEIITKKNLVPARSVDEYLYKYFSPLSVDYYTIYNAKKLKIVLNMFTKELTQSTLESLGYSMKLFQHLFSLSLLLVGDIVPFSLPLYVRGKETALRKQSSYSDSIVDPNQLKALAQEASNFLSDTVAYEEFVEVLYSLSKEHFEYRHLDKRLLHKIVQKVIQMSTLQARIDALSFFIPRYSITITRDSHEINLKKHKDRLAISVPYDRLDNVIFPNYISEMFEPFLLSNTYSTSLKSFSSSVWSSIQKA